MMWRPPAPTVATCLRFGQEEPRDLQAVLRCVQSSRCTRRPGLGRTDLAAQLVFDPPHRQPAVKMNRTGRAPAPCFEGNMPCCPRGAPRATCPPWLEPRCACSLRHAPSRREFSSVHIRAHSNGVHTRAALACPTELIGPMSGRSSTSTSRMAMWVRLFAAVLGEHDPTGCHPRGRRNP